VTAGLSGIDLSLSSPGVVVFDGECSGNDDGMERFGFVFVDIARGDEADIVFVLSMVANRALDAIISLTGRVFHDGFRAAVSAALTSAGLNCRSVPITGTRLHLSGAASGKVMNCNTTFFK
jgi:hypothetical protein